MSGVLTIIQTPLVTIKICSKPIFLVSVASNQPYLGHLFPLSSVVVELEKMLLDLKLPNIQVPSNLVEFWWSYSSFKCLKSTFWYGGSGLPSHRNATSNANSSVKS